ncbi:MAG: S9 family peptidase [Williamsia herbipolensis]|nr:S9 family peptidase [Williamsia herbipolensis]
MPLHDEQPQSPGPTDEHPVADPSAAPAAPERTDQVDVLHGVSVADPYRYLEDPDDPRTTQFISAQNSVSEPALAALPAQRYFSEKVLALLTTPRVCTPWERGGTYFRMQNPGDLDQDVLVSGGDLERLLSDPTVLLDPNTLAQDGTIALNSLSTSPDGSLVGVGLSEAGSDWQTIRFLQTAGAAAGEFLADRLEWSKFCQAVWLPDSSGVLYWRYPAPSGQAYVDEMPPGELVLHRLGTAQETDQQIWSRSDDAAHTAQWSVDPTFSSDDSWLVLTSSPGTDSRTCIEVCRVGDDGTVGPARTVIGELTAAWYPVDVLDDVLYLLTDSGAPLRRIVGIPLRDNGSGDPLDDLLEVVGEDEEALVESVTPVGDAWAVVSSVDAAHRLRVVTPTGAPMFTVELERPASVTAVHGHARSQEFFVGTTSFTQRLRSRRITLSGDERITDLPGAVDDDSLVPAVISERRTAVSTDGVPVPMSVVRGADLRGTEPRPTLLYGYGGFDIALTPSFSALLAGWVAAGGVVAVANLRGGGEFGQQWHHAGMLHRKQQVFDDLYACAQELIDSGVTSAAQLAVHGRSNGGLLAGAALTQRPDLWAATLPTVGVLDMLRFHRFTIGAAWTTEYGNPDDPADFPVLLAYSPLHNVEQGRTYPATLVCTGDHDDRVVPAHSLKFAAQLQYAQGGEAPILLRVDTRAGHGAGKPVRALAAEYSDQLAFAALHTGLVPT